MESITAKEIAQQVERYIIERGQSKNSLENYHNISAIIGHRSVDSTQVYLKTSVELLRECTLPIPEMKSDVS